MSNQFWRITYRYKDENTDSYDSRPSAAEAEAFAKTLSAEPETYSNIRISWPHRLDEMPAGEGWIAVEDLTPEQRQELDLLLPPAVRRAKPVATPPPLNDENVVR
jgi:hypothetical protein